MGRVAVYAWMGVVVVSLVFQCKTQVNGEVVRMRVPNARTTGEAINAFEQYIKGLDNGAEILAGRYPLEIKLVPGWDG